MSQPLAERLLGGAYDGYAYAYPHKTAYRPIEPGVSLAEAWAVEDTSSLFLYTHLPFCEMRCGFCNLFTTVRPGDAFTSDTLAAIARQSAQVARAIGPRRVTQAAFGGGTPSFSSCSELAELFGVLERDWSVNFGSVSVSFETSPGTLDREKLTLLRELGVDRLSLGVQSFVENDLKSLGRPQRSAQVRRVCDWIAESQFPVFNIDLIYGVGSQTLECWRRSLLTAVEVGPEELYLYPLYVREHTGLGRTGKRPAEHRRELYRLARDILTDAGYEQVSMRLFRRRGVWAPETDYCCQQDGMVGLGPGARSYTRALHYSSEYAVGQSGVRRIVDAFNQRSRHDIADYGVVLDRVEQQRRYVIKSLLRCAGLNLGDYHIRFGSDVFSDLPQLDVLDPLGLVVRTASHLQLTAKGLEYSDTIGPWLYSPEVQARMEACQLA